MRVLRVCRHSLDLYFVDMTDMTSKKEVLGSRVPIVSAHSLAEHFTIVSAYDSPRGAGTPCRATLAAQKGCQVDSLATHASSITVRDFQSSNP